MSLLLLSAALLLLLLLHPGLAKTAAAVSADAISRPEQLSMSFRL